MKIKNSYITNSSSGNFILAKKRNDFTEEQKEAILSYVKKHMFGNTEIKTKEQLDEYYMNYGLFEPDGEIDEKNYYYSEYQRLLKLIEQGYSIYQGDVSFEDDSELAYLYEGLWKTMECVDPEDFIGIDTDLSY